MNKKEKNYAFIDGQNLHLGTTKNGWSINYEKFKKYLQDKYKVSSIFYFWGYHSDANIKIYDRLNNLGYVSIFKEHTSNLLSTKKGNVDSDIIFQSMKKLYRKEDFEKIIIVSGDGDYKALVDFLIEENRFCKILFPSRKGTSSLFKNLEAHFFDVLDEVDIRKKIDK